jgi:hypothetical protein
MITKNKVGRPKIVNKKIVMSFTIDFATANEFREFTNGENGSILVRAMIRQFLDEKKRCVASNERVITEEELGLI